jgi:hemerythrin-like domain-containing protein
MIIERLSQEHRNIEKLLAILERELEVFDRGDRPDYEVIRAVISYFEVYPEVYHHPQEDLVFARLRTRDPAAAAKVGDLAREHEKGAEGCAASLTRSITYSRMLKFFGKLSIPLFAISSCTSGTT